MPNGDVLFARPDYVEDPLNASSLADGSLAKPYPVLAPQAVANGANGVGTFGLFVSAVNDFLHPAAK